MSIYTKKGDKGRTSVFDKSTGRISKASARIRAVGSVDELNCFVGLVVSFSEDEEINKLLMRVQENLFVVGSKIAGAKIDLPQAEDGLLEREIDKMDGELPPLRNFILPALQFDSAAAVRAVMEQFITGRKNWIPIPRFPGLKPKPR